MIYPNSVQTSAAVASHYDELDPFYREIWGDHVHHGYWRSGEESPREAADALVQLVAERLHLCSGARVCDIGCGYGATAGMVADQYAADVTGVTLPVQWERGSRQKSGKGRLSILLCDWLQNPFADDSFNSAYAIESSEHVDDKSRFFSEAYRVLRPGGRLVVCAWLAKKGAAPWEVRHLLEPICRHGRLPSMGDKADYSALGSDAGFTLVACEDISKKVKKTWSICMKRMLAKTFTDSRYIKFMRANQSQNRSFALAVLQIFLAYQTGSMRYCVLTYEKPLG